MTKATDYESRCTDECRAERAKFKTLGAEWKKLWPDACEGCDGHGIRGTYYESDTGYSEPIFCDCIEVRGECPRCSKPLVEDECYCTHCGANFDYARGDITKGMPVYLPDYEGEPCCEPQVRWAYGAVHEVDDDITW